MTAYLSVPLAQNTPWFEFAMTLSGVRYTLEARYNSRAQRWFLNIKDAAGNPILSGAPLLIQRALAAPYPTLALPPGLLFAIDQSGQGAQPTLASFLTTHKLIYGDPAQ